MTINFIRFTSIKFIKFRSFSLNKSQIGQPKISPIKDDDRKSRYMDMLSSTFSDSFRNKSKL